MGALRYGLDTETKPGFWIRFEPCVREPLHWKDEVFRAAREIAGRTDKPIWVCLSGGIDSEVACRSFKEQNIPFKALTLQHGNGANKGDVAHAVRWCVENGVEQKVVLIDMEEFLTKDVDRYATRYAATHPYRYLQLKLMEIVEEMGGFAVIGSGEQLYEADLTQAVLTKHDLRLPLTSGHAVPLDWCKDNNTDHEPYFHYTTSELALSYMRMPLVSFVLENPETLFRNATNIYTLKRIVYQSVFTDLALRYKADGFTVIKDLFDASRARLRERFGHSFVVVNPTVPEFERQLTEKL